MKRFLSPLNLVTWLGNQLTTGLVFKLAISPVLESELYPIVEPRYPGCNAILRFSFFMAIYPG